MTASPMSETIPLGPFLAMWPFLIETTYMLGIAAQITRFCRQFQGFPADFGKYFQVHEMELKFLPSFCHGKSILESELDAASTIGHLCQGAVLKIRLKFARICRIRLMSKFWIFLPSPTFILRDAFVT